MNINERQAQILVAVVNEYVETAQPVASKTICSKYDMCVSPATIRNDMAHLEHVGLLRQPHTSAGRVPTENGYRFYLKLMNVPRGVKRIRQPLKEIGTQKTDVETLAKDIASMLVQLSGETAFTSIGTGWSHYTGIKNLFTKPDFEDVETLRQLSGIIDRFDTILKEAFGNLDRNMNVWIGSENPFGKRMSTILVKYELPEGMTGMIGLVGPLRMDYQKNMKLLSEARKVMED